MVQSGDGEFDVELEWPPGSDRSEAPNVPALDSSSGRADDVDAEGLIPTPSARRPSDRSSDSDFSLPVLAGRVEAIHTLMLAVITRLETTDVSREIRSAALANRADLEALGEELGRQLNETRHQVSSLGTELQTLAAGLEQMRTEGALATNDDTSDVRAELAAVREELAQLRRRVPVRARTGLQLESKELAQIADSVVSHLLKVVEVDGATAPAGPVQGGDQRGPRRQRSGNGKA